MREAYVLDHLEEFFSHFLFPFCPVPTWWKQRPHPCQGLGSHSLTLTCTGMDRERGGPESMAWLGPLFPPPGIRSSMQTWSAKIEFFNNVVNVSLPKKSKALLSLKWLGILKKEWNNGKNKCVTLFYGIFMDGNKDSKRTAWIRIWDSLNFSLVFYLLLSRKKTLKIT